jgi:hypothetical protein
MAKGVRKGWAAASKAIANAGDDALVWPEFGLSSDEDLQWPLTQYSHSRGSGNPGRATKQVLLDARLRERDE